MSWSRQIWITCCTVSPSAGFWVSSAASSNNNITRNLPSFRHRRKQLCLHRRAGSSYTGNIGTHQVCTSVCRWRRANSVCLISATCGTAIDHLPGLPGWSFTEWAEHWTLELWPYRGRVWRLLQQVLTQVLTYLRVHSTYMDATQTRYTHSLLNLHIPYANSDLYFVSLTVPKQRKLPFTLMDLAIQWSRSLCGLLPR